MPKRNRDKLMGQSLYDLLVKINDGMLAGNDCIMDVFDESSKNVAKRCGESSANCGKCIADWLNEYPF